MTALSAARATIKQDATTILYPMSVSAIYLGAMVCIDASGYSVEASDATALSDVVGVAVAANPGDADAGVVDNSTGAAGDKSIAVESGKSFRFVATSITQAMAWLVSGAGMVPSVRDHTRAASKHLDCG